MNALTLEEHLKQAEEAARKQWNDYVSRCAVSNMKDCAQRAGLIPQCFSVYGGPDTPLRLLLREFGWDV